jgi:hypothetical protein
MVVGCGLIVVLSPPATAQARPRLGATPSRPVRPRSTRPRTRCNTSDPSTIHHVAIYIGNGMMVNAPFTGAFVRIDSMYAPGGLIGAVRPAG